MKRIASLVLAVLMVVCCFATVVSAAETYDATATVESKKAAKGAEVELTVALSVAATPVQYKSGSIALTLPEGFTLVSGEWTLATTQGMNIIDFNTNTKQGVFTLGTAPAATEQYGNVFKFTVQVGQDVNYDTYGITADIVLANAAGNLSVNNVAGTITVECPHPNTLAQYGKNATNHWRICSTCLQKIESTETAHVFDQEVANDDTLATPATCTEQATYFKSCECGQVSETETFAYGDLLEHTYDREVIDDEYLAEAATCCTYATYYMSCVCGAASDTETFEDVVSGYDESKHEWVMIDGDEARCDICLETKDVLQGDTVDTIDGVVLPAESTDELYENEKILTNVYNSVFYSEFTAEQMEDVFGADYKNSKIAASVTVAAVIDDGTTVAAFALPAGVATYTFTLDKEDFAKFKDVKAFAMVDNAGEDTEVEVTYTYNEETGVVTVTAPANFLGSVSFVGTPVAGQTADTTSITLWIALMAAACFGIVAIVASKKKATR